MDKQDLSLIFLVFVSDPQAINLDFKQLPHVMNADFKGCRSFSFFPLLFQLHILFGGR